MSFVLERRQLLSGMAGLGALAMSGDALALSKAGGRRLKRIGIQLYTMREAAASDPIGILERLRRIGYREVELGGPPYSTIDPTTLRRELDRIGLTAPSLHIQTAELENNLDSVIRQARTLGARYVTLPWMNEDRRSTIAQCRDTARFFDSIGAALSKQGLTFCYHNHAWEFEPVEGKLPFDIFFGESNPRHVQIQLDLHWAAKAKMDIPELFRRYRGRIPLCHVKDITADGKMVDVGAGIIDFGKLFAMSRTAGLKHYFVEHDGPPPPYWPSPEASFAHLDKLRF